MLNGGAGVDTVNGHGGDDTVGEDDNTPGDTVDGGARQRHAGTTAARRVR